MDSSIMAKKIDEIVGECVSDTMLETIESIGCDYPAEVVEQSNYKEMIMPVMIGENVDDEMDVIDQMEALESDCEPGDDDDIGSTDDDCAVVNVDDMGMQNATNDTKPRSVLQAKEIDSLASLRSKGFSVRTCKSYRKVCNLLLLQNSSKFTKHDVRCEGFPSKMTEIELISLFETCGPVFVLLKKYSDKKWTFYVTYTKIDDAERAIESFDRRSIQGHTVRVFRYLHECRLIVSGISPSATKTELLQRFGAVTSKLQSVQVFNDPMNENRIRRFRYLQYNSWEEADVAKERFSNILPSKLSVKWPSQHLEWTKTPDTLYINNVRSSVRQDELKKWFSVYGRVISLERIVDFVRIQFTTVEDATRAANGIDKRLLGNENVDIRTVKMSKKRPEKARDRSTHPTTTDTLYFQNLQSTISASELRKIFTVYGEMMSVDKDNNSAAVRFRKSEDAKRAAQNIDKRCLGDNVQISFVDVSETSDTLYIYNVFADMTTKQLRTLFSVDGEVTDIDLTDGFAIVRFHNKNDCERSMQRIDRTQLGKAGGVEILFFAKEMR